MNDTERLKCYIPKILPLVYDESLSYYETICKLIDKVNEVISSSSPNTFNYANPIDWDITTQYAGNTVVIDAKDGTAYISLQPVPAGVYLTNEKYWTPIFNYNKIIDEFIENVGYSETKENATRNYKSGTVIFIKREAYIATRDIQAGELFITDSNVKKIIMANYLMARYDPIAEKVIFGGINSTESVN